MTFNHPLRSVPLCAVMLEKPPACEKSMACTLNHPSHIDASARKVWHVLSITRRTSMTSDESAPSAGFRCVNSSCAQTACVAHGQHNDFQSPAAQRAALRTAQKDSEFGACGNASGPEVLNIKVLLYVLNVRP